MAHLQKCRSSFLAQVLHSTSQHHLNWKENGWVDIPPLFNEFIWSKFSDLTQGLRDKRFLAKAYLIGSYRGSLCHSAQRQCQNSHSLNRFIVLTECSSKITWKCLTHCNITRLNTAYFTIFRFLCFFDSEWMCKCL